MERNEVIQRILFKLQKEQEAALHTADWYKDRKATLLFGYMFIWIMSSSC